MASDSTRRRAVTSTVEGEGGSRKRSDDDDDDDEFGDETSSLVFNMEKRNSLAAYELAPRPGVRAGYMHKRAARCCKGLFDCLPIWNKRYFVIYGDFLYRYGSHKSKKPKGVPIMLSTVTARRLDIVDKKNGFFLEIGDFRKDLVVRCKNSQEREDWISWLNGAKVRITREKLGHLVIGKDVERANQAGNALYEAHIKRERQQMEVQLKSLNMGIGGPDGTFGQ